MDTLPPNENVRLIFTGLLVFSPIQQGQCRVAILNEPGHQFRIQIEENDIPIRTLTSEVSQGDIILEVSKPQPNIPLLDIFTKPGFARRPAEDDDQDFGWLLKLDSSGGPARLKPGVQLRSILLQNGIFHSAGLSPVGVRTNPGLKAGQPQQTFMAEFVADNIYLAGPDSTVTLKYGPGGANSLVINRKAGARYVVRMLNDPPDGMAGMPGMNQDKPGTVITTDFHFYYDFFEVPPADQVDVLFKVPAAGHDGTGGHPCGPGGG